MRNGDVDGDVRVSVGLKIRRKLKQRLWTEAGRQGVWPNAIVEAALDIYFRDLDRPSNAKKRALLEG